MGVNHPKADPQKTSFHIIAEGSKKRWTFEAEDRLVKEEWLYNILNVVADTGKYIMQISYDCILQGASVN